MANSTDAQRQQLQAQILSNPAIVQALLENGKKPHAPGRTGLTPGGAMASGYQRPQADVLKDFGITLPGDAYVGINPQTNDVTIQHESWFKRNAGWLIPGAFFATAGLSTLATPAAAAAPAGATPAVTSGAAGPLAADEVFTAGPIAGTGMAGVDVAGMGGAAATGFGAALKAALPTIIGAGAQVGGAAIAAHGNTEAAKIAAAQQDRALAQAKEIYQQQRADLSPYREEGFSALGPLNFGLGLPPPQRASGPMDQPAPSTMVAPGAVDANGQPMSGRGVSVGPNAGIPPPTAAQQSMGTLNQMGGSSPVRIQDPTTGLVHFVPPDQVAAAQQAGGRIV